MAPALKAAMMQKLFGGGPGGPMGGGGAPPIGRASSPHAAAPSRGFLNDLFTGQPARGRRRPLWAWAAQPSATCSLLCRAVTTLSAVQCLKACSLANRSVATSPRSLTSQCMAAVSRTRA